MYMRYTTKLFQTTPLSVAILLPLMLVFLLQGINIVLIMIMGSLFGGQLLLTILMVVLE